ncbi:acyl-CoA dehydrogenase family protein [Zavarzinia compransoris]|uniref:acyl-CoA dehydrogenase family protein n=1 Tax=Zavarzinia marina TaxID=2911065 RepID=UPI001F2BFA01|nr:acyl-CoA dehydrogenase family protein [Zavarzinia marina]MCF4167212.1 acyl-CoA dehydrogenase family protein [Zavarzinia marina]
MFERTLKLSEEDRMVYDNALKFFERECVPHNERWDEAGVIDREAWEKAGAAGLLCATMPEEYGGSGLNFRASTMLMEAQIEAGASGPGFSLHSDIVAPYIHAYGSEEQKQRWLPRMATGELIGAIAMTEPGAGSDLQGVRTSAKKDGNHYVINGQKTFITNGQLANLIIVVAKTDPTKGAHGTSLIVVETDEVEGFRRGRNLDKVGMAAQDTSELFFDEVRVPTSNLLGHEEGQGFIQLMQQLPSERLQIGVTAIKTVELALAITTKYTKERTAFGKPVFSFQNTRFKLAEIATEARIARVFVDHCIELLVEGKLDVQTAAMAKWWCSELQCKAVDECLQLHGGYGFMMEYPIAKMFVNGRVQKIYGGTNEIMKELISRML